MSILKSFRFPAASVAQLVDLAKLHHTGNQTNALLAAIANYHAIAVAVPVGWLSTRFSGRKRCSKCGNDFEAPAFVPLLSTGQVLARLHCPKCAK